VGGALLKLICERSEFIAGQIKSNLKVVGLINIEKMIFDEDGVNLKNWREQLKKSGSNSDVEAFIEKMKALKLPNSVLIDCTASDSVVKNYLKILASSISIVTPNKIANTQSYKQFLALRDTASKYNVQFRYGTNVGATLPIIATLKDMIANGDRIIKIEGVFSGTLSFIFNTLKEKESFSEVVKIAKEKGYTEPDPRDDLLGLDMARKLLILIRESGIPFELKDIEIEKLLSPEAENAKSLDGFYENLKNYDKKIIDRKRKAAEKGCVLCYIARYENGKAKLGIEEIDKYHPFYGLTSSENIVAFTTTNYKECPLTIKGLGAGAEYTAGGILSDILRISNYLG